MATEVLDACSLIAYLVGEPGGDVVEDLLSNPDRHCFIHAINLCEVYYQILRISDEPSALQVFADLRAAGLVERGDIDEGFWREVARHKVRGRISLADCFCLTLSIRLQGRIVTTDHAEFDPLVPLGLCPILFIR